MLHLEPWHIWIISALLLFIIEIFTPSFVAGSIGIGAFFAGIVSAAGFGINWQLITLAIFTLISLFTIRPVFIKLTNKNNLATNADALIGQTSTLIQDINTNYGYIMLNGDKWRCTSVDGSPIQAGTLVEVIKIEGITLFVKPKNKKS